MLNNVANFSHDNDAVGRSERCSGICCCWASRLLLLPPGHWCCLLPDVTAVLCR